MLEKPFIHIHIPIHMHQMKLSPQQSIAGFRV